MIEIIWYLKKSTQVVIMEKIQTLLDVLIII